MSKDLKLITILDQSLISTSRIDTSISGLNKLVQYVHKYLLTIKGTQYNNPYYGSSLLTLINKNVGSSTDILSKLLPDIIKEAEQAIIQLQDSSDQHPSELLKELKIETIKYNSDTLKWEVNINVVNQQNENSYLEVI